MYHEIADVPRETLYPGKYVPESLFQRHLQLLKKMGKNIVSLETALAMLDSETAHRAIVMTFDDGYRSFAETATPAILAQNGTAIVFVVSDCVGGTNQWDTQLGDMQESLMSWDQIREVKKSGMVIGAHTKNHVHLDQCELSVTEEEIIGSKSAIESEIGEPCSVFCYPYGGYNRNIQSIVKKAGFDYAFATLKGGLSHSKDRFALPRVAMRCDTSPAIFVYKLWRLYAFDR